MKLFTNGHIHTPHGEASAVLVNTHGTIDDIFLHAAAQTPRSAQRIDLSGGWLLPGFEDAHNHPTMMGRVLIECDTKHATTLDEAYDCMTDWMHTHPSNEWIVAHGWSERTWGMLTSADLDRVSLTRPLFVIHISYHEGVVNTAGLRWLAEHGITISHHNGEVTEEDYQTVEMATLPHYEQLMDYIPRFLWDMRRLGITTTHDMWITSIDELRAYRDLDAAGQLPTRVEGYINPQLLRDPAINEYLQHTGQRFTIRGVKLFLDGAIGARTAYVHTPYEHSENYGKLRWTPQDALAEIVRMEDAGLHSAAIHAIGDAAVSTVLDIYTQAAQMYDVSHYRIEHCEMIPEYEYARLRHLGVWPILQPNFHWDIEHYNDRLGDRVALINPLQDLHQHDVRFTFGSDHMPSGPLEGIHYATNVGASHQRLSRADAMTAYRNGGAVLGYTNRGVTAVGSVADFVLLQQDPFNAAVQLTNTRVVESFSGGVGYSRVSYG